MKNMFREAVAIISQVIDAAMKVHTVFRALHI
jgi:hypothetical protein